MKAFTMDRLCFISDTCHSGTVVQVFLDVTGLRVVFEVYSVKRNGAGKAHVLLISVPPNLITMGFLSGSR